MENKELPPLSVRDETAVKQIIAEAMADVSFPAFFDSLAEGELTGLKADLEDAGMVEIRVDFARVFVQDPSYAVQVVPWEEATDAG